MRHLPRLFPRQLLAVAALAVVATLGAVAAHRARPSAEGRPPVARPVALQLRQTDPLEGGVAWLNTGGPITLRELRGKIVLLDFWTYCCINCHHVLPDLAKLEEKYKDQLVVIGVHTPKFFAERDVDNVRRKVQEYGIKHPVVCDSDQVIWTRMGVNSWPTLMLIDPEGNTVGGISGEGHYAILDDVIGKLVKKYREKGELKETPVKFFPENEKPDNTPLLYPGKVLADAAGRRLFVSDTGHNRLIVSDPDGKNPVAIGSGTAGRADGTYDKAQFHRPQGMALVGQTLYVADTENHAIRAVDLKARTVATVAGTGEQSHAFARAGAAGPARTTALNSPWDLTHVPDSKVLYVAMAGPHQIWRFDTEAGRIGVFAGTGSENITDGPVASAAFAQPSGLATDGRHLFVADSEVSAVREVNIGAGKHTVRSIVGEGLFEFGDIDGRGDAVRLQHCLGVAYGGGKLYIADTYNNKIKVCNPDTRAVESLAGTGKPGEGDAPAQFYQPGGLSLDGSRLYVADTNNHKVRVLDLDSLKVRTVNLDGLTAPRPRARRPTFPNATVETPVKAEAAPGDRVTLSVSLPVADGEKLNEEGTVPVLVETPDRADVIASDLATVGVKMKPAKSFTVEVPLAKPAVAGDVLELKLSVASFVCNTGSNLCTIKSHVWPVTVSFTKGGPEAVDIPAAPRQ